MSSIRQLQPQALWSWFAQICEIPHPSYSEETLARFIVDWAEKKGLDVARDDVGNILIHKKASTGMADRQGVILQAHLDMVPQANESTSHDFKTDPIKAYVDGDWVTAQGTTLGADNGIGMAAALAVLDSDDIAHPDLEVLLTMTEEAGMEGALGLRAAWLQNRLLINLDTEEDGEIYVGCAGGENANIFLPVEWESGEFAHHYHITLKGLVGGHSGCDIHENRGNAIKLLARFLAETLHAGVDFRLSHIQGGSIRNAIPREASLELGFNGDVSELENAVETFARTLRAEFSHTEPTLEFFAEKCEKSTKYFAPASQATIINALNCLPNGVIRHSDAVVDTVETSLSIGVLRVENDQVKGTILIRSLIESGKAEVKDRLRSLMVLAKGQVEFSVPYPGWEPQPDSPLLHLTQAVYNEILGEPAKIKVIHAGLECGLLKKIYPELDVVSIGPTIRNAHSPDEKVLISAVQTFWQLLKNMLAQMPKA